MTHTPTLSDSSRDRAVSTLVGMSLIIAFVLLTSISIYITHVSVLSESQGLIEADSATKSLNRMDGAITALAMDPAQTRSQTEIYAAQLGSFVAPDAGSIRVTVDTGGPRTTVVDAPLGSLRYSGGTNSVVYQGGAVWQRYESGELIRVSDPMIRESSDSLVVMVPRIAGDQSTLTGGSVQLEQLQDSQEWPNSGAGRTNPVGDSDGDESVEIRIQSPYYTGWADYFREETSASVSVNNGANRVTATFDFSGGDTYLHIADTRVRVF